MCFLYRCIFCSNKWQSLFQFWNDDCQIETCHLWNWEIFLETLCIIPAGSRIKETEKKKKAMEEGSVFSSSRSLFTFLFLSPVICPKFGHRVSQGLGGEGTSNFKDNTVPIKYNFLTELKRVYVKPHGRDCNITIFFLNNLNKITY